MELVDQARFVRRGELGDGRRGEGLGPAADDAAPRALLLLFDERLEPDRGRGVVGVDEGDDGGPRCCGGVEARVAGGGGAGVGCVAEEAVGQLFFSCLSFEFRNLSFFCTRNRRKEEEMEDAQRRRREPAAAAAAEGKRGRRGRTPKK